MLPFHFFFRYVLSFSFLHIEGIGVLSCSHCFLLLSYYSLFLPLWGLNFFYPLLFSSFLLLVIFLQLFIVNVLRLLLFLIVYPVIVLTILYYSFYPFTIYYILFSCVFTFCFSFRYQFITSLFDFL